MPDEISRQLDAINAEIADLRAILGELIDQRDELLSVAEQAGGVVTSLPDDPADASSASDPREPRDSVRGLIWFCLAAALGIAFLARSS